MDERIAEVKIWKYADNRFCTAIYKVWLDWADGSAACLIVSTPSVREAKKKAIEVYEKLKDYGNKIIHSRRIQRD